MNAATIPQRKSNGKPLANRCLADAKRAGISAKAIKAAADNDLVGYMYDALKNAAEMKLDRLLAQSRLDRFIASESK